MFLLAAGAVALVGLSPTPAAAQAGTCIQDEFNSFNGTHKTLSCTANDVSVAGVTGFTIIRGGFENKCVPGASFDFVADFEIKTTSTKTRSNIGIFFGTGQSNAISGTCSDAILSPTYTCPGTGTGTNHPTPVTCGDPTYEELDHAINGETAATGTTTGGCGDTSSTDNSGAGTQFAELEVDGATCPTSGTTLLLPECTSWWQPTTTMPMCNSSPPDFAWVAAAVPGTSSKCSCGTLSIPIQPISPSALVQKACTTTNTPGPAAFTQGGTPTESPTACDAGAEGSTVTYTVEISNTSNVGGIIIDQICDNRYGQVFPTTGTCPAGTVGSIVSGSASTCASLGDITTTPASCTFQAVQGENLTETDTVTVTGHTDIPMATATFGPTSSNTVTVTSSDAPSSAKTFKGLEPGPQTACATVRYDVTVMNTSSADETLSLSAINDTHYGSITTTHGTDDVDASVLGTTCGVASGSPGLGTLSGTTASSANGGSFPATLAPGTGTPPTTNGGSYKCMFDGVICGTPGTITTFTAPAGTCSSSVCSAGKTGSGCSADADCNVTCSKGIQDVDSVTATITGDESELVTVTPHLFTASVCLAQSGQ